MFSSSLRSKRGSSTLRNTGRSALGRTSSSSSSSAYGGLRASSSKLRSSRKPLMDTSLETSYSSAYGSRTTRKNGSRGAGEPTRRRRRDAGEIRKSSLSQLFSRKTTIGNTSYGRRSSRSSTSIRGSNISLSDEDQDSASDDQTLGSDFEDENDKSSSVSDDSTTCDKCDSKKHKTSECPHYRKKRGSHPDEQKGKGRSIGGEGGNFVLKGAKVVRQPGDGSCLFHSLCYGLSNGTRASTLRREIASFIAKNPSLKIADSPLSDWIKWESNSSVKSYAARMSRGGWGGGIEMAAFSRLYKVNVHVYERKSGLFSRSSGYRRISCFNVSRTGKTIHILYGGRVHYDALVPKRAYL